jgi:hypothetical protein
VPAAVKQRRLQEVIDTFHTVLSEKNKREVVGTTQVVLVESATKRAATDLWGKVRRRVVFCPAVNRCRLPVQCLDCACFVVVPSCCLRLLNIVLDVVDV